MVLNQTRQMQQSTQKHNIEKLYDRLFDALFGGGDSEERATPSQRRERVVKKLIAFVTSQARRLFLDRGFASQEIKMPWIREGLINGSPAYLTSVSA